MEDKKKMFEVEVSPSGKMIYKHIANGLKRIGLLNKCKAGEITVKEMHRLAKKAKYLFSESEYLKFIGK